MRGISSISFVHENVLDFEAFGQQRPHVIAAGIDLGGTKIEAQLFDADWKVVADRRIATPDDYRGLLDALAGLVAWADQTASKALPIGICHPGLTDPRTGQALAANIPTTGHPFMQDISDAAAREISCLNDCRALALSEAAFGHGRGHRTVAALVMGTGIGGGLVVDKSIWAGPTGVGGEFGHGPLPAHLVQAFDLPIVACGCGRLGCVETLTSGPGLTRLAEALTGRKLSPVEIAAGRVSDPDIAKVWDVWCQLVAETLHIIVLTVDPDVIVLGGGLSQIDGVAADLSKSLRTIQLAPWGNVPIHCAQGGDASGARGAAYYAMRTFQ